jgi:hypothetical protein
MSEAAIRTCKELWSCETFGDFGEGDRLQCQSCDKTAQQIPLHIDHRTNGLSNLRFAKAVTWVKAIA